MKKPAYEHLLSPVKVGNMVLKNRMLASSSVLHFLQGPETYPTEAMITHIANKAKNGAAMVTCRGVAPRAGIRRITNGGDIPHMFSFDLFDPKCQNYLSQMADAVHAYNSKLCMNLGCRIFDGYDVIAGLPPRAGATEPSKELTPEMLQEIADDYAEQAAVLKSLGFDAVSVHMAYRHQTPGRLLSPLLNHRTDEYGGSLENRVRFPLMVCERIKKACGWSFPIEVLVSAEEPVALLNQFKGGGAYFPGKGTEAAPAYGTTLEDTIAFAKMAEGYIDILQLRAGVADPAHPTGFETEHTPFTHYAEAVKAAGVKMLVTTVAGYQEPKAANEVIASGKADLVAMARAWICDSEYGQKIEEDRAEDIVPCLRCNKCHGVSMNGPWYSQCSVNPLMGIEHRYQNIVTVPTGKKKVAVIGGGPAGMKAAILCSDRGHEVTLYEKENSLGGQIRHADFAEFKWPLRDFKNYLIAQVEKRNITVYMNTAPSREELLNEGYDHVIAAIGASPITPPIPGVGGGHVHFAEKVYGHEEELGKNVVIIGGGDIGCETGIYLAQKGHDVTVLEMRPVLAADATPLHYRSMFQIAWENEPNFHAHVNAKVLEIGDHEVVFVDCNGVEQIIPVDDVVLAAGTRARQEEAMAYFGSGGQFAMIGDCNDGGSIHKAMRTAFATASRI